MNGNPKFCGNCGNTIAPEDLFCGECGSPVSEETSLDHTFYDASEDSPALRTQTAPGQNVRSGMKALFVVGLIFFVVVGVGFTIWWLGQKGPVKNDPGEAAVLSGSSGIKIVNVTTRFVENSRSGRILIIAGQVRNEFPQERSHIKLLASLLMENGSVIKEKTLYCGNIFSESELIRLDTDTLGRRMLNPSGNNNSNVKVGPGKTVPFMAVFSSVTSDARKFTVKVVDSSPG